MKYLGEDGVKTLIGLIKDGLKSKQDSIVADGVLVGDGAGTVSAVETQEVTTVEIPIGIVKGTSTGLEAAVAGTDYVTPSGVPVKSVDGATGAITTNAVKYTSQSLTDAQKSQARTNIGAGTSSFSGSYEDLTKKPTIGNGVLTIQKNGTSAGTFSANATSDATVNITVPTTASEVGAQSKITASGLLKGDGNGGITAAVEGEDYSKPGSSDMYQVGDIKFTTKSEIDDKWLLCNGETFDASEYPELNEQRQGVDLNSEAKSAFIYNSWATASKNTTNTFTQDYGNPSFGYALIGTTSPYDGGGYEVDKETNSLIRKRIDLSQVASDLGVSTLSFLNILKVNEVYYLIREITNAKSVYASTDLVNWSCAISTKYSDAINYPYIFYLQGYYYIMFYSSTPKVTLYRSSDGVNFTLVKEEYTFGITPKIGLTNMSLFQVGNRVYILATGGESYSTTNQDAYIFSIINGATVDIENSAGYYNVSSVFSNISYGSLKYRFCMKLGDNFGFISHRYASSTHYIHLMSIPMSLLESGNFTTDSFTTTDLRTGMAEFDGSQMAESGNFWYKGFMENGVINDLYFYYSSSSYSCGPYKLDNNGTFIASSVKGSNLANFDVINGNIYYYKNRGSSPVSGVSSIIYTNGGNILPTISVDNTNAFIKGKE